MSENESCSDEAIATLYRQLAALKQRKKDLKTQARETNWTVQELESALEDNKSETSEISNRLRRAVKDRGPL